MTDLDSLTQRSQQFQCNTALCKHSVRSQSSSVCGWVVYNAQASNNTTAYKTFFFITSTLIRREAKAASRSNKSPMKLCQQRSCLALCWQQSSQQCAETSDINCVHRLHCCMMFELGPVVICVYGVKLRACIILYHFKSNYVHQLTKSCMLEQL